MLVVLPLPEKLLGFTVRLASLTGLYAAGMFLKMPGLEWMWLVECTFTFSGEKPVGAVNLGCGSGLCRVDGEEDEVCDANCDRAASKGKPSVDWLRRLHLVMLIPWCDAWPRRQRTRRCCFGARAAVSGEAAERAAGGARHGAGMCRATDAVAVDRAQANCGCAMAARCLWPDCDTAGESIAATGVLETPAGSRTMESWSSRLAMSQDM